MAGRSNRRGALIAALAVLGVALLAALWARSSAEEQAPPPPARATARRDLVTSSPRARREPLRLAQATITADGPPSRARIEGRVVSGPTGLGVDSATVWFDVNGSAHSVRANGSGDFVFDVPFEGRIDVVEASAAGYSPHRPEWGQSLMSVQAQPGKRVSGLRLLLWPRDSYRVRVIDHAERPVEGARVTAVGQDAEAQEVIDAATTDGSGVAVISAPRTAVLSGVHPTAGSARVDLANATDGKGSAVLQLLPGGRGPELSIRGRVVEVDGRPASEARVVARYLGNRAAQRELEVTDSVVAVADAEGSFAIGSLYAGPYQLYARRAGAAAILRDVQAGRTEVVIELRRAATLRGRVIDRKTGAAVPAFMTLLHEVNGPLNKHLLDQRTVLGSEGRFEVADVADGRYELVIAAFGYALSPGVPLRVEGRDVEGLTVELDSGRTLVGRVRARGTETPLPGAEVILEGDFAAAPSMRLFATTTADANGKFRLPGLDEGEHSIFVRADGYHSKIVGVADVAADEGAPLDIELTKVLEGEKPTVELLGIGAVLTGRADAMLVGQVLPGGGAAEKGLAPGDEIVTVDGVAVVTLGFAGSIQKIRGPESSTVVLGLRRGDAGVVDLAVPRRRIQR